MASMAVVPALPVALSPFEAAVEAEVVPQILDMNPDEFPNEVMNFMAESQPDLLPGYPSEFDIGEVLQDKPNQYKTIFEPWKTKAAIHAVAFDEPTGFLALGGGYLYDNEVHIWRLNSETYQFDKVWDSGDSLLRADVMSLAWGDTDLNDFREVVAASSDGFVYVFEQRHIFDPYANTENMFDHVWTSPYTFRAFDVKIYDADRDYREDIIIGGWDGKVRCFEYTDHSNYPFSEEHWIEYREVWNSNDTIDGQIYTIGYGDTNFNGLPEIIAGTRQGRVYVFENDGVHLMINGEPFPLINDNNYELVWTSQNYTWTPIMDMKVGELDATPGEEIALVAQGQGVFVLNWDELRGTYDYQKVFREWDNWQTSEVAPWRLDFWADAVVSSNNVTFKLANGTEIPEPITYTYIGAGMFDPDAAAYPYNTGMANATDYWYSYFHSDVAPNATAVIDFGKDEEGTGSASPAWDLVIRFASAPSVFNLNLSIGQSPTDLTQINVSRMLAFGNYLYVDVDDVLGMEKWDWFRYLQISVFNGAVYLIDSIELMQVYTQITSALTIEIGPLPTEFNYYGPPNEPDRLVVSTVIGNFYAFDYNSGSDLYDLVWDSSRDDFFSLGTNVWDMVYVGSETRIPIWLQGGVPYALPPASGTYRHWSVIDLDYFEWAGSTLPHEVLIMDEFNDITVYDPNGPFLEEDLTLSTYFFPIESWIGPAVEATVETALLATEVSILPTAITGVYDPGMSLDDIYGTGVGEMAGNIWFWHRFTDVSSFGPTPDRQMADLDVTGDIVTALSNSKTVPRMEFVDYDSDGDFDMILSNGFLYYCENLGLDADSWPMFYMHEGYFESLNTQDEMNDLWGQPETWDIDQDGDLDLILSYDSRKGATCYLNDGTADEPIWVKTKKLFSNTNPDTNLKFNNYTNIRMVPIGWGLPQDWWYDYNDDMLTFQDAEYTMMAFKEDLNILQIFWPVYSQSSSYILATYPTVSRYEFAVQSEGGLNFGYHHMESWSTESDLHDWTLTVRTGDVDADGKGEVIVGDYDNNIYIFEHLLNNTYKRAFRSFDISYTEESDTSPYMWEELEGVSGTFNRVIWDHVKHIVADTDLDGDGYKELIAAAGLQVYVFEDTGIDDTYDHAYTFDMRNNPFIRDDIWINVTEVTAIGAGDDFDNNGENELLVALGPFLFVYNIPFDTWTYQHEYFMRGSPEGRFYLVGNGAHPDFNMSWIQTFMLCDPDEDGYSDLILGGKINNTQIRQDGFLKIYEWKGVAFEEVWEAPPEVTTWNPVTSIALDDQDYDSRQEIVIGHNKGFDLWEWGGTDDNYTKVEVVTSSPNYPIVPLQTTRLFNDISNENYTLTMRGDNDIANADWNGDFIRGVFCQRGSQGGYRIWFKNYLPTLDLWGVPTQIYTGDYGYGIGNVYEMEPSLFLHSNGSLYLTWRTHVSTSGGDYYNFWVSRFSGGASWTTPLQVGGDAVVAHYPSLFERDDGSLGMVFVFTNLHWGAWFYAPTWTGWLAGGWMDFKNWLDYDVYSADITTLYDRYQNNVEGYAYAISGRNRTLAKTDLDIFVAISNSSFIWPDSPMYQATSSYDDEVNPDIGRLDWPENTLVVVYETVEAPIEDRIQMSYSNSYTIWRKSEPLATLPPYIDRVEKPGGQVYYFYEGQRVYAPLALSPSVLGLIGGGFMQTHSIDFYTKSFTSLAPAYPYVGYITEGKSPYDVKKYVENADWLWGINPSSRFTHFNIRGVVDLDVGDTDGDGRREVVAGFDDRAAVYELKHSNVGRETMEHEEAWLSNKFPTDVTGVSVYDSNGNGYEEIAVSCHRGEVYVFEIEDAASDRIPLLHSKDAWNITIGTNTVGYPGSQVVVFDIDNDGKAEFFKGESDGTIRAFDDDGSQLWKNDDHPQAVFWMEFGWLGPAETFPYLLVSRIPSGFSPTTNVSLIHADTGVTRWHQPYSSHALTPFIMPAIGDVHGDDTSEVILTNTLNELYVVAWNGTTIYSQAYPSAWVGMSIAVGNFSENPKDDIALVHTNGTLTAVHGHNGSVMFHIDSPLGWDNELPVLADVNKDGWVDLVLARDKLYVIDLHNQSVLYNSSVDPGFFIRSIFVDDYDNDTNLEAILVGFDNIVYEKFSSGRLVWAYEYNGPGDIEDAMPIVLPGDRPGIAFVTSEGNVAGMDSLTGVVMWFAQSNYQFNEVVAGDFDGDGIAEIGGVDYATGHVFFYEEVVPWEQDPTPNPLDFWSVYWTDTLNFTQEAGMIYGVWTADVDNDGIDDYAVGTTDNEVRLYNPVYPQLTWAKGMPGIPRDVKFADFLGTATLDLLVLVDGIGGQRVMGFDGDTGSGTSIDIVVPSGYLATHIAVGDFQTGITGTEFAVVYHHPTTLDTGVGFYTNAGGLISVSGFNGSLFVPTHVLVGNFDAGIDGNLELMAAGVTGGTDGDLHIWQGDGTHIGSFAAGYPLIADIQTANIGATSRTDVIIGWDDGWVFSWEPNGPIFWTMPMDNTIDAVYAVDLLGGNEHEIVVNLREVGLVAYDGQVFTEVWRHDAPTAMPKDVVFDDITGDGSMDFALHIYDRIAVYEMSSAEPYGVYHSPTPFSEILVGNFDDQGPLDLAFFRGNTVYAITEGMALPPPPPLAAGMSQQLAMVTIVVAGSILLVFPVAYFGGLALWARRRRRLLGHSKERS
jgi:hypothetical protein